jgi:cytidine deaminase
MERVSVGVDQNLIAAIVRFIEKRFPNEDAEGAAGMYTDTGRLLLSTSPETLNDAAALCHETGCLCDAYCADESIVASACLLRVSPGRFVILPPCGVCQERLFLCGPDVSIAVPCDHDAARWTAKKLHELQPYHWRKALE